MNIYTPYVYLIGWSALDQYYIGSRYKKDVAHPSDLWTTYFTSSTAIARYREEYGEPDIIMIRNTFTDGKAAHDYETKLLRRIDARHHPKLINSHNNHGGFGGRARGYRHTEETKQKMSASAKGKPKSPEQIAKMSARMKGKPAHNKGKPSPLKGIPKGPFTPEHCRAIGEAHKGKLLSEEHKAKLKGRTPWNKGKAHSDETKQKISERAQGRPSSRKGVVLSDETKNKVSQSKSGTSWITDGKQSRVIRPTDVIPDGWYKGRTISILQKS